MKVKKARKPRGTKLNGRRSYNLCSCCLSYGCDPLTMSDKFKEKADRRSKAGVCRSCGHNPCRCKSTLFR